MKKGLLLITYFLINQIAQSQCDSLNYAGNYTINSDQVLSGTLVVGGTFKVSSGATLFITSFSQNGCGELKVYANNIIIEGTIDGNYSGYSGGSGGIGGTLVTSTSGDELSLTQCNDPDNTGNITVQFGASGMVGMGPGAGVPGGNGGNGTGSKQYCGNTQDDAGLVGGAGGAGGGSGGAYGGASSISGNGGAGAGTATTTALPISQSGIVAGGNGGSAGTPSSGYGTADERDIDLGSGGAGAGAGGKSYYSGLNGGSGGKGGGLVFLKATTSLTISGTISVNGETGGSGGNGGSGDATADCCSDGCNGCDERTFSAGAGAGAGGGGGSGGAIFIESLGDLDITGTLNSVGGNGGTGGTKGTGANCNYEDWFCGDQSITADDGTDGEQGGAGSGGRVKIYVADCANATINGTINVSGGTGFTKADDGTYQEVCGYLGLDKATLSLGWNLFPNPAETVLNIQVLSKFNPETELVIFDAIGRKVMQIKMMEPTTIVNIEALPAGLYSIKIVAGNSLESKRFVKQ